MFQTKCTTYDYRSAKVVQFSFIPEVVSYTELLSVQGSVKAELRLFCYRKGYNECRAVARFTFNLNRAAIFYQKLFADHQAQP